MGKGLIIFYITFSLGGDRMSYYQPIRSASVLETLLEPPRLSSGPLVSYLTQGTNGMSSAPRVRSSGVGSEVSSFCFVGESFDCC